jgi:hypothetical protein
MYTRAITLSAGATPPREFRIFRAGANPSTKGVFHFGPAEALAVMSAWRTEGSHRLPLDVEHASLDSEARALRADAGDAIGWFTPALRGGELWATQVEFGPVGLERLARKSQTYFSPAFSADKEGRVRALINVALVSMPALHGLDQLVAAGKTAIVSARVSPAARAALYLLAAKRKNTISAVLLSALDTLANAATTAPTRDQVAALKAVTAALGLPAESSAATIKSALSALLEAAAPPEPSDADPLAASPDAPPAQLSRADAPPPAKPDAYGFVRNSAAAFPTTPEQGQKWLADRAAQRAKRSAKQLAPGKINGR